MKKTLSCILFFLLVSVLAAQSIWFDESFDQAKARAAKENKMILIDFYSDG